ncbi:mechanosensitive ion channel family protein [Biformimicrobium ophioploci]|nr:mechanosensitive ion channel domain-containing protein [Microbulbifer sp. NKW57]
MTFESFMQNKLLVTLAFLVVALIIRKLLLFTFAHMKSWQRQDIRRRSVAAENLSSLVIGIGVVLIWVSEIREFALSIAAFAVAIVLALRDMISCFVGGIFQASRGSFTVGDWVKIGDQMGEVIDREWLSTTLHEIDPHGPGYGYTGTTLYIPNSVFLTQSVKNLNFMRRYVEHKFTITRENKGENIFAARKLVEAKLREYAEPFHEVAERYASLIEHRMGVELSGPEPEVRVRTNELGHDELEVAIFCPREEAVKIEQKVVEDVFNSWYGKPAGD